METLRIVLLHFGIAAAMAAAFGATSLVGKIAGRISFRLAREDRRRRTREAIYWRALSALPAGTEK
jgi:hypothetical protein